MDIAVLKAELLGSHPGTGPYSADAEVAAGQLNTVNRFLNKTEMTATEVFNAIDETELNSLTSSNEQRIWNILSMGVLNPFGLEATIFISVFGDPSATITALKAARKISVSRAMEIGIGFVRPGNVTEARL